MTQPMTLNEYQESALTTRNYDAEHEVLYPMVGLAKEAGEALANSAKDLGFTLEEIAQRNLDKIFGRQQQGTTLGNGDHR